VRSKASQFCRQLIAAILLVGFWHTCATGQQRDTIPTQAYFGGIEYLYEGRYRDAERILLRELRNAIKTVSSRWIDSICYHAMLGEVYYHQGRLTAALEQFDQACEMFLQNPQWMLRVRFSMDPRPLTNSRQLPWGGRKRPYALSQLPASMLISLGQIDNSQPVRQGGVIQQAQYWKVDVVEVLRTTALAIRRRNELLGPLGRLDGTSRALVTTLSRGGAPPNHWSRAWIDLQLGLAQMGTDEARQALPHLERATLLAGKFDHRLTCIALLEMGRLQMLAGDSTSAATTFAEASYLAFYYEDIGVLDDVIRLGTINYLAGSPNRVYPHLEAMASWARRKRWDHLYARLNMALAEQLMVAGNWDNATTALGAGQSRLRDARTGLLGNLSQYLDARIAFHRQRDSAAALLAGAVENQIGMSKQNLQIALTNAQFDTQQLSARNVVGLYQLLLADPTAADWLFRPLESLAVLKSNHQGAYDRWLAALVSRKDTGTALEVADLAKRRRYHQVLPWGGRLAALRDIIDGSDVQAKAGNPDTAQTKRERNDLLLRYPDYGQMQKEGRQAVAQLRRQWWPGQDERQDRKMARIWKTWADTIARREAMLRDIGLEHVAATITYPPRLTKKQMVDRLQPGQALLVFHQTPSGLLGFLQTATGHKSWNLGSPSRLGGLLTKFLRGLGNHDANRAITADELTSTDYQEAGNKLYSALFQGSSIDPKAIRELIVVPDHLIWYVPLEGLPVTMDGRTEPMIANLRIRYAPTVGLALAHAGEERRQVQRTGLLLGDLVPGDNDEERQESVAPLREVVAGPIDLQPPLPAPSPLVGSLLDTLLVLREFEVKSAQPFSWSPLQLDRGTGGSLGQWLALPLFGPRQILLPGMRTQAERGFKTSRRQKSKGKATTMPGDDLFFASCGLMSTGTQTLMLSRWRVGGQSTLDLVREFVQELPHTSAANAWQRSVQLAMESPIDPLTELRVKRDSQNRPLTAAHPFFWSGYLVVDTGSMPLPDEDKPEKDSLEKGSPEKGQPENKQPAGKKTANSPAANRPAQNRLVPKQTEYLAAQL
jgi:tetratricopeptide (TPR) repeat protein